MTIKESIADTLNRVFRYNAFKSRDKETLLRAFKSTIHGSASTYAVPLMNDIIVVKIDSLCDLITLIYDDIAIEVYAEWRMSANNFILMKFRLK